MQDPLHKLFYHNIKNNRLHTFDADDHFLANFQVSSSN